MSKTIINQVQFIFKKTTLIISKINHIYFSDKTSIYLCKKQAWQNRRYCKDDQR